MEYWVDKKIMNWDYWIPAFAGMTVIRLLDFSRFDCYSIVPLFQYSIWYSTKVRALYKKSEGFPSPFLSAVYYSLLASHLQNLITGH
jgi:hypothetical protein